jgi:tetratricopeptide (TPR) repeat protein
MAAEELRLEATAYEGPERWRWVLTGPGGQFLADHEVRLDQGCWQYGAFTDLLGYLRLRATADPDCRVEDEARIVAGVGEWIGEQVLGPVGPALAAARPTTVRVIVPEAAWLAVCPLELAHVNGCPIAMQDITLVIQAGTADCATGWSVPVGGRLRVLGLFSVPTGGQALGLRRERHALVGLFSEIAAVGRAAEMRVLQYGVTRRRLKEMLEEGEGWDIIHISGHGAPGELLLEKEDGTPDRIRAKDLADLLDLARERLKLVTVSACWSAALKAAEIRRLLHLSVPEESQERDQGQERQLNGSVAAALATELTGRLGCAVLAMRYPVTDDFAIALVERLYDLLAGKGRPLPRAVGMALKDVVADPPTAACPALSAITPALFGARAAGLRLAAPQRSGPESYDTGLLKLAGFPPQPDRFVGRTAVMARASAALAPRSGASGVMLHGMPGGGKTACALELAYTHEHAFDRLAWFKAPNEDREDIAGALTQFALTLEKRLPGLQMVHVLGDAERLAAFLPELTELCEQRRVLIVIDNIESLLTQRGQWRDIQWGQVIGAMCAHAGLGRLVLTSRRMPGGLAKRVRAAAVDALTLDEALLLAREMPHLSKLIGGSVTGVEPEAARKLALGVLNVAQGHPKLLELADGQAADPDRLQKLIGTGGQAWRETGGLPEGFFTAGETRAEGQDYLHVLDAWTDAVADGLSPGGRDLFGFLCCLEEDDRIRHLLKYNWTDLWQALSRPGTPADLDKGLAELAARGLVSIQPGTEGTDESYYIHPVVAAAGRAHTGQRFCEAVDTGLARCWSTVAQRALKREEGEASGVVVRAGLGAAPYLLRLGRWLEARALLSEVLSRDHSAATAAALIPALRKFAHYASGSEDESAAVGTLARALDVIDPAGAEQQMHAALAASLARQDYWNATALSGDLGHHYLNAGRLDEALRLAKESIEYIKRAGLGPWTQLSAEVKRLQVLAAMGQSEHVLAEVNLLGERMKSLLDTPDRQEAIPPWAVREMLLEVGRSAAQRLERWQKALELNAAALASAGDRGALVTELAKSWFNDYHPLIRLGRSDEALELLGKCREVFEGAQDIEMLGKTFAALAEVENDRGNATVGIDLGQKALRYAYRAGDVDGARVGHHLLGYNFRSRASGAGAAIAHHLAAAIIRAMTGGGVEDSVRVVAYDLEVLGDDAMVPADVAELCRRVAEVPGVDLERLLAQLPPVRGSAQQRLEELIAHARTLAAVSFSHAPNLAGWDPVIAAIAATVRGDSEPAYALDEHLAERESSPDWAALVSVLRRIVSGERGPGLLDGLDEIDAAIADRTLDALAGRVVVPVELWQAMSLAMLLGDVVAAVWGYAFAAGRARQALDVLAQDSSYAALASVLGQILAGEQDPGGAAALEDPADRAAVATVLHHIRRTPAESDMTGG